MKVRSIAFLLMIISTASYSEDYKPVWQNEYPNEKFKISLNSPSFTCREVKTSWSSFMPNILKKGYVEGEINVGKHAPHLRYIKVKFGKDKVMIDNEE